MLNQTLTKLLVTVPVLKDLLKDKGIVLSSKAKKSELVYLFDNAHDNTSSERCGCMMKVKVSNEMLACTRFSAAAYDSFIFNCSGYIPLRSTAFNCK